MGIKGLTRREFLTRSGMAGGVLVLGSRLYFPRAFALTGSARIRVGLIGLGRQGSRLLQAFVKHPGVEVAALCDVSKTALDKSRNEVMKLTGRVPFSDSDSARLIQDKNLDAVSIATPNHLHAPMATAAIKAGKDCYVESPSSHFLFEGQELVAAANKHHRVVQYGQAADLLEQHAIEIAAVGSIQSVKTICFCEIQKLSNLPPRRNNDHQDVPTRFANDGGLPNWRDDLSLSNGPFGAFALPALHQSVQLFGGALPDRASTLSAGPEGSLTGHLRLATKMEFETSGRVLDLELVSLNALTSQTMRLFKSQINKSRQENDSPIIWATTIRGSRGSFSITQTFDLAGDSEFLVHNFIDAVHQHKPELLASPIERGNVSATALHLANASLTLKRPVFFNHLSQQAEGDSEAQKILLGLQPKRRNFRRVA